jgi:hypothetical protein
LNIPQNVAAIIDGKIAFQLEGIDRMYLNGYIPHLQTEGGIANFFRHHRGKPFASSVLMNEISTQFVASIERFAEKNHIPLIPFARKAKKEDIAKQYLASCVAEETVLFIGKIQEKVKTVRTKTLYNPKTGAPYPSLYMTTAMPNQYYFYVLDKDFGMMFIKYSSYFPYNIRFYLNGHEYLKRRLTEQGIAYVPLDNGLLSCADPGKAQRICDGLDEKKIDRVFRKWLARLPHPFTAQDRAAGYRYDLSILQAEFSLTQVFDRPHTGRTFFEEVIRENLDLGRPDNVTLIFGRKVTKRTPGSFRTRVITEGVTPSLHIDYKRSKIKQYHKEGRALRTETTINNTYDFGIGKRLKNLPELREIGFTANRRLLSVQRLSHDCTIGSDAFASVIQPTVKDGQRAAGLKFGDPRVMALLSALCLFSLIPTGFTNGTLRERIAELLGKDPDTYKPGAMTYDLRRLRLHGFIERIAKTNRYLVTPEGLKIALFVTKTHNRLLRSGLSQIAQGNPMGTNQKLSRVFKELDSAMNEFYENAKMAA